MRAFVLGLVSTLFFAGAAISQGVVHSSEALECSRQADARGLHGAERLAFRSQCKAVSSGASPQASSAPSPPIASIVFPKGISPNYSQEPEGQARMHTCLDQYNANKATNAGGGMRWIEPGGGYYSVCNERLKSLSSSPPPPMASTSLNPSAVESPKAPVGRPVTMQECAAKYQAAKAAGMLDGRKWNDFRSEECNADAAAAAVAPLAASAPAVQFSSKPSFDCAAAKSASARLICSDSDLIKADAALGNAYRNSLGKVVGPDRESSVKDQIRWIRERNVRCHLDGKRNAPIEELRIAKPCMLGELQERATYFTGAGGGGGRPEPNGSLSTIDPSALEKQPLSPEEVEAFRKLMSSWSPPAGAASLDVHFRLNRDGTIDGNPEVLTVGSGSTFEAAKSSALGTLQQAQPFKMFRPESYQAWKDMVVTFEASSAKAVQPR
jgi:uncharacterized protein YecT (DUF1311 family)